MKAIILNQGAGQNNNNHKKIMNTYQKNLMNGKQKHNQPLIS